MTSARSMFVLLFLVFCLLLTSGCGWTEPPGYFPNRDIIVVKITSNDTSEWVTAIDTGHDDISYDIIQTSDGNFIVTGSGHQLNLFQVARNGSVVWEKSSNRTLLCDPDGIVSTSTDSFATISYAGEFCRYNSHGDIVWNRSTQIIGSDSIYLTADGGYIIQGINLTTVPLTYANSGDLSPEYVAWQIRNCGNSTPDTNASCNWGSKNVRIPFSAVLDREGNVIDYQTAENTSAHSSKVGISGTEADVKLTIRSNDGRIFNVSTGGTGKISVPADIPRNSDGWVIWEVRIDSSQNRKLGDYISTFAFKKVIKTSDNGYALLASIDKK